MDCIHYLLVGAGSAAGREPGSSAAALGSGRPWQERCPDGAGLGAAAAALEGPPLPAGRWSPSAPPPLVLHESVQQLGDAVAARAGQEYNYIAMRG